MRLRLLAVPLVAVALIASACGSDNKDNSSGSSGGSKQLENTGKVNLLSAGEPEEVAAYQQIFDDMINKDADYKVEIESSGNFEEQFQIRAEGGTLDVAAVPQPGSIPALVKAGNLTSLEDLGMDIGDLENKLGKDFVALGEVNGKHYGVPTNINLKSMVWYPKKAFDAKGYKVPKTWDEMLALSDQIKADGSTPWCVGFGSEGSTGWPATDWMEDIMLRTAGTDTYDKWVKHEIPFNDASVKKAGQLFGDIMFKDGYVLGGAKATPDIAFGDAPGPMFENPPKCWLHRQASFINSFFPKSAKAGVDYDWFVLPPIDKEGILYGGELSVVGKNANRPEVRDFLEKFLDEPVQCEMGKVVASSRISPNVNVKPDCYANKLLADSSVILSKALKDGTGRFDASDLMPSEVGTGSFWTGMIEYMKGGPDNLDKVLQDIEDSWPKSSS